MPVYRKTIIVGRIDNETCLHLFVRIKVYLNLTYNVGI